MKNKKDTISKFYKVKCPECNNEQVIFSNPSSKIVCLVCDKKVLAESKGGRAKINAQILEVIN